MNIIKNTVVANTVKVYAAPMAARYWRIVKAPLDPATGLGATVQLQFEADSSATQAVQGNWGKAEKYFSNINVTSNMAGEVWVEWGVEGWTADVPLPRGGAGGLVGPFAVNNTPVGPDLMEWPIGSGLYVSMKSSNGQALNVGGRVTTLGIYSAGSAPIDVRAYGMLRLTAQPGPAYASEFLTLVDSGDITMPVIPIYDAQFRLLSKTGRIPFDPTAPQGSVYYADLRGVAEILFFAGTGIVAVYLEPNWEPAQAPEDEILTAVVDGAAPMADIVPAVVGRKIRVYGYRFDLTSADTVYFQDGAGTKLSSSHRAATKGQEDSVKSLFETAVGQPLQFAATIGGFTGSVQVRYSLKED